jgi:hypothetical protein
VTRVASMPLTARADQYFLDLPIYRLSLRQHTAELKTEKRKYLAPLKKYKNVAPESYANADRWFDRYHWYPWRYNEIIGWMRLYALGTQIRGELWCVKAKRITRRMKKKFFYVGKAFERSFRDNDSNERIAGEVARKLKQFTKERWMRKRSLDLECFQAVAPALNWRRLLGFR